MNIQNILNVIDTCICSLVCSSFVTCNLCNSWLQTPSVHRCKDSLMHG